MHQFPQHNLGSTTVFSIDNNQKYFLSSKSEYYNISEDHADTEECSNDAEINYSLTNIHIEDSFFHCILWPNKCRHVVFIDMIDICWCLSVWHLYFWSYKSHLESCFCSLDSIHTLRGLQMKIWALKVTVCSHRPLKRFDSSPFDSFESAQRAELFYRRRAGDVCVQEGFLFTGVCKCSALMFLIRDESKRGSFPHA